MKKLITLILIVLCLSVLFAMPASADEYTDPLATKFDDTVGYCDAFYDTLEWYAICQANWTFVDWNYEGEPPLVQVPADEYEAELAEYCVLSDELISAIRSYTYYGEPIYNPEKDTYTAFFVGGWGGFLHNRVYSGYIKTGDDTYDVYYETVTFEFLDDVLPDGMTTEDIIGDEWPETVEYGGQTYTGSPDGYYRIKSYDKCGVKYGVKVENGSVLLATRTPYTVGQQPDVFDDVTVFEYITYEIVDGEAIITGCDWSVMGDIFLPDTLGGYPVTKIGEDAFSYCESLTGITIPDSVTSISDWSFFGCSSLSDITIGDNVTSIGNYAFYGCKSLTGITIPDGVTSIGNYAFGGCSSLTSITIPDSVTSIGDYAFEYCSSLTGITIPDGVTSIGEYMFQFCSSLTSITIPDGVTSIGNHAFYYCSSLASITIPDSVTSIGSSAFSYCTSLTSITIGDGVTTISVFAFNNCLGLTDVYYCGTEDQWRQIDIHDFNEELTSTNIHFIGCTHSYDNACDATCNNCGETRTTNHNYKNTTTKATLSKNGSIVKKCSVCGKVASTTAIAKPTTFTLSTVNYTYNGAVKTPGVTVKDANGKTLVKGTDYTVTYPAGRKALGAYTVTITMKGNYSGTKTLTFNINLGIPNVTVANATNGVKISWNAISGAKNYKVYKSVYSGGKWSSWVAIKTGVTGTTYTDTSVKSNDNVKYTVRAFNGSYSSTYKSSSSIKYLAAPTVTVSNAANGVKLSWNKIAGTKTYTVYKSVYSGGKWSGWKAIKTGVTGTTYTDTSVKSNDNVKYTVRAFNGNFSSTFKSSASIKFLATPTVKAANAAKGVTVTWNKITGAKTYTVYRSVYSGGKWSGWTAIKTGVTGTSYTDTTVKSGATVRYTVKAINGNFRSNVKAGNTTKFLAQPAVKVAKATNGIKATWGKSAGATGYIVYRRTFANGKWGGWTAIKTTTAVSFTDTTAKKGVTYQYTVRAYSGDYKSSYTNSTSIKR